MISHTITHSDELYHYGTKGQKWGVRRFENPDGTLTPEGRARYRKSQRAILKDKSAGRRIAGSIGKGLIGGTIGTASLLGGSAAILTGGGKLGLRYGMMLAGKNTVETLLAGSVGGGLAIGLGTLLVSGIASGVQAAKVRKGYNFMNKYEQAYKKTYSE